MKTMKNLLDLKYINPIVLKRLMNILGSAKEHDRFLAFVVSPVGELGRNIHEMRCPAMKRMSVRVMKEKKHQEQRKAVSRTGNTSMNVLVNIH